MGVTTYDKVRLRKTASTSGDSKSILPIQTYFEINGHAYNGNEMWYYVAIGSSKGYIRSDMLRVLSPQEAADYVAGKNPPPPSTDEGATATAPPAAVTPPSTYRTLKEGSTGDDVRALQQKLKDLGIYTGSVTGNFGSLTATAVRAFQKAYGLYVDGIAGVNTQSKLYGTSAPSSGPNPVVNGVYNIPWETFKNTIPFPNGSPAVLTDVRTGKSFNIIKQSAGNHLDVEPATLNDTNILKSLYNGNITYVRRPVWLTVGGKTYAGSIYAVPHGQDTVPNNGYAGQFCVHLLNSKTHVGDAVDPDHQKCVQEAYNAAKNRL